MFGYVVTMLASVLAMLVGLLVGLFGLVSKQLSPKSALTTTITGISLSGTAMLLIGCLPWLFDVNRQDRLILFGHVFLGILGVAFTIAVCLHLIRQQAQPSGE